jgi:hypothetical protein
MSVRWCEWKGHWKPEEVCRHLRSQGVRRCRRCPAAKGLDTLPPKPKMRTRRSREATPDAAGRVEQLDLFR